MSNRLAEALEKKRQELLNARKAELSSKIVRSKNLNQTASRKRDSGSLERNTNLAGQGKAEDSNFSQRTAAYDRVQKLNLQKLKSSKREELMEAFSQQHEEAEKEKQRLLKQTQVAEASLQKQQAEDREREQAYYEARKKPIATETFEVRKARLRQELLSRLKQERTVELHQKYHPQVTVLKSAPQSATRSTPRIHFESGSTLPIAQSTMLGSSAVIDAKRAEMVEKAKLQKVEELKRRFEMQKAHVAKQIQAEELELKKQGKLDESKKQLLEQKRIEREAEIQKELNQQKQLAQRRATEEQEMLLFSQRKTELVADLRRQKLEAVKRRFEMQKAAVAKEIQAEESELKRYGAYTEQNQLQLQLKKTQKLQEIDKLKVVAEQKANKEALLEAKRQMETGEAQVGTATVASVEQQQSLSSVRLPNLGLQPAPLSPSADRLPLLRPLPQNNVALAPYISRYVPGASRVMPLPPLPDNLDGGPVRIPKDYQFQIESFRSTRPERF